MTAHRASSIVYFETEGRANLGQVLRVLKRAMRKRPELRATKVVFLTALGEGPSLAYSILGEFDPSIIAVTPPPNFSVRRGDESYRPQIPRKIQEFFKGVNIKVVSGRLPFDRIEGAPGYNEHVRLIRDVLSLFGGSFSLTVQAVLAACDSGHINPGETVIGVAGDSAAVMTASTTEKFLSREGGLAIHEILCKPRNLTVTRASKPAPAREARGLFQDPELPAGPPALGPDRK